MLHDMTCHGHCKNQNSQTVPGDMLQLDLIWTEDRIKGPREVPKGPSTCECPP